MPDEIVVRRFRDTPNAFRAFTAAQAGFVQADERAEEAFREFGRLLQGRAPVRVCSSRIFVVCLNYASFRSWVRDQLRELAGNARHDWMHDDLMESAVAVFTAASLYGLEFGPDDAIEFYGNWYENPHAGRIIDKLNELVALRNS